MFEKGFRGIGGGFSAVGNVKYRHNYNSNSVSGSGVQVFWPDNEIKYNFFEDTFESAYQLHSARLTDIHGPSNTVFSYNTIKNAPIESNLGDPDTVVENNNFYPNPDSVFWAWGLDKQSGLLADMTRNWWGTPDVEEIRRHVIDGKRSPEYADSYMELLIEPVLTGPNGFGFVRGKVADSETGKLLSRALIKGDGFEVRTNVVGGFFASLPEGLNTLTVELEGYEAGEFTVEVAAAEVSNTELLMMTSGAGS